MPFFGNPSLAPEQGWTGDLGLDWEPDTGTRLSITGYYQRFDDLIQLTLAPTLSLFVGENVPDARIWGFELEGSQGWGHGVTTGIDYTYTDSRDLDSGLVLPRRPHHQGPAYCEWQLSAVPVKLWSEIVYRGSHFDDSEQRFIAGHAVYLNAQVRYRISRFTSAARTSPTTVRLRSSASGRGAAQSSLGCGWTYDIKPSWRGNRARSRNDPGLRAGRAS